jgi:cytochrome c-type biogenesis protein CcmH
MSKHRTHSSASLTRRGFVVRALVTGAGTMLVSRAAGGQVVSQPQSAEVDSSNLFAMDQTASRPVRLAPKPGARASMTAAERDELEHTIRCQCGCTLDVFTCRTTDFACRVSPAMHRDIMSLVEGGYSAQEIIDEFVRVYGEKALMAPTKEGFNLLGWMAPFVAVGGGALVVLALLRSWRRSPTGVGSAGPGSVTPIPRRTLDATNDELARLQAQVRDDG